MAKSIINVLVNLDTKKFNQQLGSTSGKLAKFGGGAIKSMAKVGAAFGGAAVVAGAAFGKIAFSAAETAATSNARIQSIADSMGLFGDKADEVSDRLINFAETSARLTGVNQNVIKEGQALLLTFGNLAGSADEAGGAFDRATQLTMDLAAAGFGSVTDNAKQLGKALNDPVKGLTALSRSGITFTDEQRNMIAAMVEAGDIAGAQNLILAEMETQVGGTAEATANASDQISVGFSQITERIGLALLPAFTKLTDFVLDKVIPGIDRLVDVFEADGLSGVFEELRLEVAKALPKVLRQLRDWGSDVLRWFVSDFLPLAIDALADVAVELWRWVEPQIKPTLKKLGEWAGDVANWIVNDGVPLLVDNMIKLGEELVNWISPRIVPALVMLAKWLAEITAWIITEAAPKLAEEALKLGSAFVDWALNLFEDQVEALEQYLSDFEKWVQDDAISDFREHGIDLGKSFLSGLSVLYTNVAFYTTGMLVAVAAWVTRRLQNFAGFGFRLGTELMFGLDKAFKALPGVLASLLVSLAMWVANSLGKLLSLGASLASMFIDGIRNKLTDVDTWKSIGRAALDAATTGLSFLVPGLGTFRFLDGVLGGGGGDAEPEEELAKGGIVRKPTIALIGEAGPEAVIPLDRVAEFGVSGVSNSGNGGVSGAPIYVTVELDGRTIAKSLEYVSERDGGLRIKTRAGG